ncbi:MAG: hypothetical protein P8M71_05125 [Pseudomonadales bacterium]|nr:hypothetical protein [Pseudomonadales bacterium]
MKKSAVLKREFTVKIEPLLRLPYYLRDRGLADQFSLAILLLYTPA